MRKSVLMLAALLIFAVGSSDAQFRMPRALVWTAYDVGSAGYSQAASIGHAMSIKEGITLRVIPAGNDVARLVPLANSAPSGTPSSSPRKA